jgi:hypothetical protein
VGGGAKGLKESQMKICWRILAGSVLLGMLGSKVAEKSVLYPNG